MAGFTTFFCKKYALLSNNSALTGKLFYISLMGLMSMLSFWLLSGCNIQTDSRTLTFSIISSFIYVALNVVSLLSYAKVNLVLMSIFTKSVTIANWLCSVLFFHEIPTFTNIFAVIILFIAVFMPLLDFKKSKSNLRLSYLLGGLLLLLSTASAMTTKVYLQAPAIDSASVSSLLFFSHGLMGIFAALILLFRRHKNPAAFTQEFSVIRWSAVACIFFACLFGNPQSLLTSLVMQKLPLVQYTVLTAALESIMTFLLSKFIFKETIGRSTLIAFALSTFAMLINAL